MKKIIKNLQTTLGRFENKISLNHNNRKMFHRNAEASSQECFTDKEVEYCTITGS